MYGSDMGGMDYASPGRRSHFDTTDAFSSFFKFRDPEDVFKEFFNNDPFGSFSGGAGFPNGSQDQFMFSFGLGNLSPFVEPYSNCFSSFTTFSSNDPFVNESGTTPKANVKRTTTSTKYVNGKKVETRK